jgi:hypothetical protein
LSPLLLLHISPYTGIDVDVDGDGLVRGNFYLFGETVRPVDAAVVDVQRVGAGPYLGGVVAVGALPYLREIDLPDRSFPGSVLNY